MRHFGRKQKKKPFRNWMDEDHKTHHGRPLFSVVTFCFLHLSAMSMLPALLLLAAAGAAAPDAVLTVDPFTARSIAGVVALQRSRFSLLPRFNDMIHWSSGLWTWPSPCSFLLCLHHRHRLDLHLLFRLWLMQPIVVFGTLILLHVHLQLIPFCESVVFFLSVFFPFPVFVLPFLCAADISTCTRPRPRRHHSTGPQQTSP